MEKMVIGPLHVATANRVTRLLTTKLLTSAIVSVQNPIILSDSEPEPDLALLVPRDDFYAAAKPEASDVLLVIEVADSPLAHDRAVLKLSTMEFLLVAGLVRNRIQSNGG